MASPTNLTGKYCPPGLHAPTESSGVFDPELNRIAAFYPSDIRIGTQTPDRIYVGNQEISYITIK